jgi:hypothetical protein
MTDSPVPLAEIQRRCSPMQALNRAQYNPPLFERFQYRRGGCVSAM